MMTTQQIEQAILEAVQDIYHKKYVGKLKVSKLPNGYTLQMWFNKPESSVAISAELDDEKFIKFIKEELRKRHFELVQYFMGYKYDPQDLCNQNINRRCSCNDQR